MRTITLHRTHILSDGIKGYITVEGTSFSCYSLEAQSVEGHNPLKPQYAYALPLGTFQVKFKANDIYAIVPFIQHKPYKRICFIRQDGARIRPGCIAIGTRFLTERFLDGADKVFGAIRSIVVENWDDFKDGCLLQIVEDEGIVRSEDGTYEEDPIEDDDSYNFVNL